jgi:hypothetical protein
MDKVSFVDVKNINLVSNVVPEAKNEKSTVYEGNNKEVEKEKSQLLTPNEPKSSSEMASKYEKTGDVYERVSQHEQAINSYQVSYTLKPNPGVVEKVDDITAKIVSEKFKENSK